MLSQFFGNYLLNENLVTPQQLVNGIQEVQKIHKKIGELAIRYGFLTKDQVEKIHIMQTEKDKRFGELAVESGYMSQEELDKLLSLQHNDYELLCKILIDDNAITKEDCYHALQAFLEKHKLGDLDNLSLLQATKINILINDFYDLTDLEDAPIFMKYLILLFNNITRFIGTDFTPQQEFLMKEPTGDPLFYQKIVGDFRAYSAVYASKETLMAMASRYAEEEFTDFDEYVEASIADFLNLHNGVFTVNMSNEMQMELMLEPPAEGNVLDYNKTVYCIPVSFPFGTLHFVIANV